MIYFVHPAGGGPIKIGTSKFMKGRLRTLEIHYGTPLALLKAIEGGRTEEKELHRRFASARLGYTEQFRPTDELMAFIGVDRIPGLDPESVEAMVPVERPSKPAQYPCIRSTFKISQFTGEVIRQASEGSGISTDEFVTRCIRRWLQHEEWRPDFMHRHDRWDRID